MENKNWFPGANKENENKETETIQRKRLTVDIDKKLFTAFKAHCVGSGESMGTVVAGLLENHLKVNDVKLK